MDHATGVCTVPKHANRIRVRAGDAVGFCKSKRGRKRGGAVSCTKAIVYAFGSFWKSAHAAAATEHVKLLAPTGDQLVDIALMPYVKNNFIVRRQRKSS